MMAHPELLSDGEFFVTLGKAEIVVIVHQNPVHVIHNSL